MAGDVSDGIRVHPPSPNTSSRRFIAAEDLNHDGRPDKWRLDDVESHLTEVFRDLNHDGRPDVREYYEQGALVRRESDRNFDNLIDLIEDFDTATGDRSRSVTDLDSDGRADLLVLFRGADAVFVKSLPRRTRTSVAHHTANAPVGAHDVLLPLEDPFDADMALRPAHLPVRAREFVGFSTAGGVPAAQRTSLDAPRPRSSLQHGRHPYASTVELQPGSPRARRLLPGDPAADNDERRVSAFSALIVVVVSCAVYRAGGFVRTNNVDYFNRVAQITPGRVVRLFPILLIVLVAVAGCSGSNTSPSSAPPTSRRLLRRLGEACLR